MPMTIILFFLKKLYWDLLPQRGRTRTGFQVTCLVSTRFSSVTDHNTGISLLLSTSAWVLLSPSIACLVILVMAVIMTDTLTKKSCECEERDWDCDSQFDCACDYNYNQY